MSLLARSVQKGVIQGPKINVIYGPNKVGKTTFVCSFPNHILLDLEKGSDSIKTANRAQMDWTLDLVQSSIDELLTTNHGYKTLGIDSVEALEGLVFDWVCKEAKVTSIEDVGGGFGKGFTRSREIMREMMGKLQRLTREKGMEVFLIGHSQEKTFTDPLTNTQYNKFTLRTNEKMASIIKDIADNILFVNRQMLPTKANGKDVVVSDNKSYIYTSWRTAFDAGNRIGLPFQIELDYAAFMTAKESSRPVSIDELKVETLELIKGLDKETRPKAEMALKAAQTLEEVAAIKLRAQTFVTAS